MSFTSSFTLRFCTARSSRLVPSLLSSRICPSSSRLSPSINRYFSTEKGSSLSPESKGDSLSPATPPATRLRTIAEQRHPALPANFKEDNHVPDEFDTWKPDSSNYHIIFIFGLTLASVLAFDIYWSMYLKPKPLDSLDESKFGSYELSRIIPITETSSLFRFKADIPGHKDIFMPSHVALIDDECQIGRSYTPIAYDRESFDLLIKSRYVHRLKEGDMVEMRGPILSFPYEQNMVKEIGMIAGGTGITPMYQLIKHILRDTEDTTKISLIYANKDEILLERELQILQQGSPDRLKVFHVLENGGEGYGKGYITKRMLSDHLPKSKDGEKLVLVCGPDGMVEHLAGKRVSNNNQGPINGLLKELKYSAQDVFKF